VATIEAGIRITIGLRCRISLLSPFNHLSGSERIRPRTLVLSFCLRVLFFFFPLDPCHFSSLHAWVIPSTLYLTELFLTRLAPWFLFFLWNICCSSSRDVLCCFCPLCFDMVSCTPLGVGHILQDSPGGLRILFNAIATPLMLFMTSTVSQKSIS